MDLNTIWFDSISFDIQLLGARMVIKGSLQMDFINIFGRKFPSPKYDSDFQIFPFRGDRGPYLIHCYLGSYNVPAKWHFIP